MAEGLKPLQARVANLVKTYEETLECVKNAGNQEMQDFLARRLYEMTADIIMSLLILDDATRAPELFEKSAQVYVRHAEAEVAQHAAYIKVFDAEDLANFRAVE